MTVMQPDDEAGCAIWLRVVRLDLLTDRRYGWADGVV